MKLIAISANILVNPESISCVEQKTFRGVDVTYVWVGEKNYILEIPLDEFYKSIQESDESKQIFGG